MKTARMLMEKVAESGNDCYLVLLGWRNPRGEGSNSRLGMTVTCRLAFKGKSHMRSFGQFPYPFVWIFGRQSLLNIPEIKFHFTLNAQHEGKVATNHVS